MEMMTLYKSKRQVNDQNNVLSFPPTINIDTLLMSFLTLSSVGTMLWFGGSFENLLLIVSSLNKVIIVSFGMFSLV